MNTQIPTAIFYCMVDCTDSNLLQFDGVFENLMTKIHPMSGGVGVVVITSWRRDTVSNSNRRRDDSFFDWVSNADKFQVKLP